MTYLFLKKRKHFFIVLLIFTFLIILQSVTGYIYFGKPCNPGDTFKTETAHGSDCDGLMTTGGFIDDCQDPNRKCKITCYCVLHGETTTCGMPEIELDCDGDNYFGEDDCNDLDLAINPGMPEIFGNNIDDNCDKDWKDISLSLAIPGAFTSAAKFDMNPGTGQDCCDMMWFKIPEKCNEKGNNGANCQDTKDNNCNHLVDCDDPICGNTPPCGEVCDDNKDNDGDGKVDCADSDCRKGYPCREGGYCDWCKGETCVNICDTFCHHKLCNLVGNFIRRECRGKETYKNIEKEKCGVPYYWKNKKKFHDELKALTELEVSYTRARYPSCQMSEWSSGLSPIYWAVRNGKRKRCQSYSIVLRITG